MGGIFSSEAETRQDNLMTETGQQVQDSGQAVSLGTKSALIGSRSKNNTVSIATTDHGAISSAIGFASNVLNAAYDTVTGAATDSMSVAQRSNELSAMQTSDALSFAQSVTDTNAGLAYDAMQITADAYQTAQAGLLSITSDFSDHMAGAQEGLLMLSSEHADNLATTQNEALLRIDQNSQAAQEASLVALDYVFESGKSETERTTESYTKWMVGGAIALAVLPILARIIK